MISIFKRKPKEETVSRAEHERIVAGVLRDKANADASARRWKALLDEACKAVDDLRPDADKYREKLRRDREYHANRRQARDKQQAEVGA